MLPLIFVMSAVKFFSVASVGLIRILKVLRLLDEYVFKLTSVAANIFIRSKVVL